MTTPAPGERRGRGDLGNRLWVCEALWRLGSVQFGDFTLGRTTQHSPV